MSRNFWQSKSPPRKADNKRTAADNTAARSKSKPVKVDETRGARGLEFGTMPNGDFVGKSYYDEVHNPTAAQLDAAENNLNASFEMEQSERATKKKKKK